MVEPLLEAHTEWVDPDLDEIDEELGIREWAEVNENVLKWTCPECEVNCYTQRRYATKRCPECEKIMQAANYDCSSEAPDPQNPKKFLRSVAKRRGFPYDYYYPDEDDPEPDDPLAW